MFYAILIFLLVIVFLLCTTRGNQLSLHMTAILVCYMMALIFLALYVSKDTYYYNTANHYFAFPKSIWKIMLLAPIEKRTIIRLINFFVLGVIYLGILFSLTILPPPYARYAAAIRIIPACLIFLELLLYDPAFFQHAYLLLYPRYLNVQAFHTLQNAIHACTVTLNLVLLLMSLFLLALTIRKTSGLRMLRLNIVSVTISYLLVILTYLYIFIRCPIVMLRVSRLSGIVTYLHAPLWSNNILYTMFPYFLIFSLLLIAVCVYASNAITIRSRREDFSISKQIAASDITSRTFCHYMKNELLAIQAELDDLELNGESVHAVQNVVNRCEHLYKRLDDIHHNTHSAVLIMQKVDLREIIHSLAEEHLAPYSDIRVISDLDQPCPPALIDRNYFEQAVLNIFSNAVEACQKKPEGERRIWLTLRSIDNWIVLSIRDSGIGIPKEHLSDIFMPFYTSEPIARHWGIGLSMTHKLITAHEGHIEVESTEGIGTTFQIMLPSVQ